MDGQNGAITKIKGPCAILAGAGTGKTHTIVEKIKYLITQEICKPEKIVCITFSNEAANNILVRVRKAIDFGGNEPVIKTFHAFSADILRKYGERIGINKDFSILTPDDAKIALHRFLKVAPNDCHKYIDSMGVAKDIGINIESLRNYNEKKISEFGNIDLNRRYENLQFELRTLYLRKEDFNKKQILKEIEKIGKAINISKFISAWGAYEKLKKIKNYQDYSDLNNNALRLLKENPEISEDYSQVIVDEFQDTNKVQLEILFYLARQGNITVVGDLNQSIYRFRGAYKKNFNEFKDKFRLKNSDIFNLDKSHRCPNKILRTAHRLILNNYDKSDECFEVLNNYNKEGDKIEVYRLNNGKEEARKVVELVKRELKNGREMSDICIMFRTHQQGRIIKNTLDFERIPYISVNKGSLLKEKSIRIARAYLVILDKLNKKERGGENAWWDLIYLLDFAEEDLIKTGKFIKENKEKECLSAMILDGLCDMSLSENGLMRAHVLIERIKKMIPEIGKETYSILKTLYGIAGLIREQDTKEDKAAMMNLNRFFELAKEHSSVYAPDLGSFIYYLEIVESLGIELESADFENNGIRLMTSHSTKGLEFKVVIITNFAQKRFPLESFRSNPLIPIELNPEFDAEVKGDDLEYYAFEHERQNNLFEERRLCYVSFTRAREKLMLTFAEEYGGRKFYPSQFLNEINYKENENILFLLDSDEKYKEPELQIKPADNLFLGNKDFDSSLSEAAKDSSKEKRRVVFSPSALLLFDECQKKYEYKYIYNMPDEKIVSWEAVMLGSFIHKVLEQGIKNRFKSLRDFECLAREMKLNDDWESVDLDDALHLIMVFFERNKNKYNDSSATEQVLDSKIGGMPFIGFADRIDFNEAGLEIIDYKTGKGNVAPKARNWQMGYYALAASKFGKVRRVTLDMLRHEKPIEFEINEMGDARCLNSSRIEGFNIYKVEEELVMTAHRILEAQKQGFKPCAVDKNCEFCGEWVYHFNS